MAQMRIHGNWKSIAALACLVTLVGLIVYAVAAREILGIWLYVFSFAAMILGFMSKEDHIAVGGITGIFLVLILDIIFRVGVLGFTECKAPLDGSMPGFSIWTGCP